ncbi:family 78 glycoside hydrolase catalytic domain [Agromyces sp. MMS24-JH15]|uniref:family 78 glycoside hydrolase catalytic domain n=1 Tax=Agromyces sp. MMS24-JH15 TaxID=3243765 RepID=UPI00374A3070
MRITRLTVDGLESGRITDEAPTIAFALDSARPGEALASARVRAGGWETKTDQQVGIRYGGTLEPYQEYIVQVEATGTSGTTATAETSFRTGRLDRPWVARWITDVAYRTPKQQSPVPMVFRTAFAAPKPVQRAWIEATALGVYELELNGEKVGDEYFAPGFTSYAHRIQVQTYDVTAALEASNTLVATVAGGWAVGSFTHKRKNMIYADRQAFLCELHLEYADGTAEVLATGPDWEVATDGPVRMAEWYDGETYDATVDLADLTWKAADVTAPRGTPALVAQVGPPVRAQRTMNPVSRTVAPSGEVVYDFGQNFAGVVHARLRGRRGQEVVFRHAEVLVDDELFTTSLRTAKATATYTCVDGEQEYSPRLTYMGFRFVGVRGIDPADLELTALVLHSDLPETGEFECSDPLLNRLQDAIRWGGRSNFVDIPTDCPQRDEREGWTGDLAVFASTAAFNFDMSRFLDKWLRDVTAEQALGGGIPMVVPKAGNPFPTMATSVWGDVCILAPWAEYLARGDLGLLRRQYGTMRRFLRAAGRWAKFLSVGTDRRRIWRFPFHFGDWAAPTGGAKDWLARGKWIGTAYYANSCSLVARIAELLGEHEDAARYRELHEQIARAYRRVFTDGKGTLMDEFQTGYVLPLHFGLVEGAERERMADNLVRLIDANDGRLSTGFPGTPYILFALSDSGRVEEAYRLLLQTGCPSWLYMIESGGTTIWERWDALRPDGTVNIADLTPGGSDGEAGGMVSFNHYAAGAVGDWMYRRIAGLEPTSGGYRTFRVAPLLGGDLTSARAAMRTPYGTASSSWTLDGQRFALHIEVPVSTTATVVLPDGTEHECASGHHEFACELPAALASTATDPAMLPARRG